MRLEEFLADNTKIKNAAPDEIIFSQGAQAEAAYCIAEGKVEIFQHAGNRQATLATLEPGQIFGEMALLRFDKYTLSAKAVEPTKLHVITPELLQQQIRATHPLIKAIIDMLVERIHNINEVLIDIDRANRG
jgi:CRP-like cAMP-binding protein